MCTLYYNVKNNQCCNRGAPDFFKIRLNEKKQYLRNIKHFPCWYTVISTRVEIGKTRVAGNFPCWHRVISIRLSQSAFRIHKCYIINISLFWILPIPTHEKIFKYSFIYAWYHVCLGFRRCPNRHPSIVSQGFISPCI